VEILVKQLVGAATRAFAPPVSLLTIPHRWSDQPRERPSQCETAVHKDKANGNRQALLDELRRVVACGSLRTGTH